MRLNKPALAHPRRPPGHLARNLPDLIPAHLSALTIVSACRIAESASELRSPASGSPLSAPKITDRIAASSASIDMGYPCCPSLHRGCWQADGVRGTRKAPVLGGDRGQYLRVVFRLGHISDPPTRFQPVPDRVVPGIPVLMKTLTAAISDTATPVDPARRGGPVRPRNSRRAGNADPGNHSPARDAGGRTCQARSPLETWNHWALYA
jgi:hypothetical protein